MIAATCDSYIFYFLEKPKQLRREQLRASSDQLLIILQLMLLQDLADVFFLIFIFTPQAQVIHLREGTLIDDLFV